MSIYKEHGVFVRGSSRSSFDPDAVFAQQTTQSGRGEAGSLHLIDLGIDGVIRGSPEVGLLQHTALKGGIQEVAGIENGFFQISSAKIGPMNLRVGKRAFT